MLKIELTDKEYDFVISTLSQKLDYYLLYKNEYITKHNLISNVKNLLEKLQK